MNFLNDIKLQRQNLFWSVRFYFFLQCGDQVKHTMQKVAIRLKDGIFMLLAWYLLGVTFCLLWPLEDCNHKDCHRALEATKRLTENEQQMDPKFPWYKRTIFQFPASPGEGKHSKNTPHSPVLKSLKRQTSYWFQLQVLQG